MINKNKEDDVITDDLYDKLLHLVSPKTRKLYDTKTRKNKQKLKICYFTFTD